MFAFDDGSKQTSIKPLSAEVEQGMALKVVNHQRATSMFNKIKENIEGHETASALEEYWERESLAVDALALFDPLVSAELHQIYSDCLAYLNAGEALEMRQF